jgi:flavin reductase (DIM6/NTAB) family NADH-FMN oxidoreductase RutF
VPPAVDPVQFRQVMGQFATGVTVLTTVHEGRFHGMTANSVTSVSLDPLLILVCLLREARTCLAIQQAERFAVNILGEHQEELSRRFSRPGQDHFGGLDVMTGPHGLPLLPDCLAYLACQVTEIVQAGDHDVVFAEVDHCRVSADGGAPLLFFQGGYRKLPGMTRLG